MNKVSFDIIRNENVNKLNVFGMKVMSLEKSLVKPKIHLKLEVAPKNEDR